MRKKRHLSIDEKRDWLAVIFRDDSGEFSQADKFKALAEDTKLAQLQAEADAKAASPAEQKSSPSADEILQLLSFLPPPLDPAALDNPPP
ncbi:MAG: hypothetical protein E7031_03860 [Akkermansiaceae bacterium]|nr:hypothetical protein [Akkermansiaceae bacterium]